MQLSPEKLKENIFNWRLHIVVQGIGFIIIPVLILSKYAVEVVALFCKRLIQCSRDSYCHCRGRVGIRVY